MSFVVRLKFLAKNSSLTIVSNNNDKTLYLSQYWTDFIKIKFNGYKTAA